MTSDECFFPPWWPRESEGIDDNSLIARRCYRLTINRHRECKKWKFIVSLLTRIVNEDDEGLIRDLWQLTRRQTIYKWWGANLYSNRLWVQIVLLFKRGHTWSWILLSWLTSVKTIIEGREWKMTRADVFVAENKNCNERLVDSINYIHARGRCVMSAFLCHLLSFCVCYRSLVCLFPATWLTSNFFFLSLDSFMNFFPVMIYSQCSSFVLEREWIMNCVMCETRKVTPCKRSKI